MHLVKSVIVLQFEFSQLKNYFTWILNFFYHSFHQLRQTIANQVQEKLANPQKYKYFIVVHNSQPLFEHFEQLMNSVASQSFQEWTIIYFFNGTSQQLQNRKAFLRNLHIQEKVIILKSFPFAGMNFYDALNNRCPKKSVAILLDEGECFSNGDSIGTIAQSFQEDSNVYLLATAINMNESKHLPSPKINFFKRFNFPTKQERIRIYQNISMHVRALKVDFFRDIYPFDVVNVRDEFYDDRIYFLFPLLEMISSCLKCQKYDQSTYFGLTVPNKHLLIEQPLINSSIQLPYYNAQAQQIFNKQTYNGLHIKTLFQRRINNYPESWGQNTEPGENNLLLKKINKSEIKIPKKVHQFWINNNELPPFKKKLCQIVRQKYEGYEYRLWTMNDITIENFPRTYDTVTQLIELDKHSAKSRMSMAADLMRLEVLYKYGGFHVDLNYQVFKTYDEFRHYPLIVGVERTYQIPITASLGTFGAERGSKYIDMLLNQQNLKGINLRGEANIQTGPYFFGKVTTMQDLYYNIKYIPAELYLPYLEWSNDPRFHHSHCRFSDLIPQQLEGSYQQIFEISDSKVLLPCSNLYSPQVYGMDHFYNGRTWGRKTQ